EVLEARAGAGGRGGGAPPRPWTPPCLRLGAHGAQHQTLKAYRFAGEAAKKLGFSIARAARLDGKREEDAALGRVPNLVLDRPGVEDFRRSLGRGGEGGMADGGGRAAAAAGNGTRVKAALATRRF